MFDFFRRIGKSREPKEAAGKLTDLQRRALGLLEKGQKSELPALLESALADQASGEFETAWLVGLCVENGAGDGAISLAPCFMQRYPESIYPVCVFHADGLSRRGFFDQASDESRAYLRRIEAEGLLGRLANEPIILDGVSRAFLLLSAVYTEAGARSYSKRLIRRAAREGLSPRWENVFAQESENLDRELQQSPLKKIDDTWEGFFAGGEAAGAVREICEQKKFPLLLKRVELLADQMRFDKNWRADDAEMLKLVMTDGKGAFLLG